MKRAALLSLIICLVTFSGYSQNNCSKFYPLNEGASFEYTSYNKKGKTEGLVSYKVVRVETNNGRTDATMAMNYANAKGKEVLTTDYRYSCSGDKVTVDYQSLIPSQMLQQYEGMDMDISGTDIELPNNLSVGQTLADANVAIKINMSGIAMNIAVDMVNRKVEKKERVTTPSGTYECYVIYSENKTKMMVANQTFPSRIWFAEGVGMIKQESYDKKGKAIGSTLLTKFSK